MPDFQDHFSAHAACYANCRPHYPAALFAYLAGVAPRRGVAWDVGTGNGQAAVGLAEHFDRVIATDASAEQVAHATPHPRVEYRVALAEGAGLEAASVDLVAIAQALHWFRFDDFYATVRRAAAPDGVIAAWCYSNPTVGPAIDAVISRLYHDITGPCWPADRRWVEERYATIPFPFTEGCRMPEFSCREDWTLDEFTGYLRSWSATQRYQKVHGRDPIGLVAAELEAAWGAAEQRRAVRWPIHLRLGRISGAK